MLQCSKCGRRFITEPDSEPGEFRICIDCHHVMVFRDDLSLRELNEDEKAEIARTRVGVVPFHPATILLGLILFAAIITFVRPLL